MELSVSNPKNPIFLSKKGISANPKKMTLTPFLWPSSAYSLMAGRPAAPFSGQRSSLDGRFDRPEFVPKESRVDEGKCGQKIGHEFFHPADSKGLEGLPEEKQVQAAQSTGGHESHSVQTRNKGQTD
ncbi:hypothetical protein TB2_006232 [Malus domestica]